MLLLELVCPMANDPDPETSVSVSTGEVRVGKTFEADRFPVPAIAFEIESLADDPIRVRLVDDIPESFAMEGVGFHPDYEGDNWNAYGDHRVAYERTLDPGESVLTVYGIRIDDPDEAAAFLEEPTVELVEAGDTATAGDVLGRETTQVVRDALSGEETGDLSGLGAEPLLDDAAGEAVPRVPADDLASVLGDRDRNVTPVDVPAVETDDDVGTDADADAGIGAETTAETDGTAADDAETVDDAGEAGTDPATEPLDADAGTPDDDSAAAAPAAGAGAGSVAAALAAEIRADRVDDDDLAALREAFEGSVPTSVDVRVGRLQSQIEDLLAYREALADFLDENGTAEAVLGDVSESVDELEDRVDELEGSLAAADADREELRNEVASATESLADTGERLDAMAADLADLEATAEGLDERLTAVEELEADVEDLRAELEELRSFRDRLSSAFGTEE
jgi:archaellum component FlaC